MKIIDHELMESLEYKGEYGGRYSCRDCKFRSIGEEYQPCTKQGFNVLHANNVCQEFEPRIKNSSDPEFNLNDYLEYLGSDYYRPWSVDTDIVVGYIDRPSFYTHDKRPRIPLYKPYDKPWCRVGFPRCHIEVDINGIIHKFEIEYKRFRELKIKENNEINYVIHLWKDRNNQKKYQKETYGTFKLKY